MWLGTVRHVNKYAELGESGKHKIEIVYIRFCVVGVVAFQQFKKKQFFLSQTYTRTTHRL